MHGKTTRHRANTKEKLTNKVTMIKPLAMKIRFHMHASYQPQYMQPTLGNHGTQPPMAAQSNTQRISAPSPFLQHKFHLHFKWKLYCDGVFQIIQDLRIIFARIKYWEFQFPSEVATFGLNVCCATKSIGICLNILFVIFRI